MLEEAESEMFADEIPGVLELVGKAIRLDSSCIAYVVRCSLSVRVLSQIGSVLLSGAFSGCQCFLDASSELGQSFSLEGIRGYVLGTRQAVSARDCHTGSHACRVLNNR